MRLSWRLSMLAKKIVGCCGKDTTVDHLACGCKEAEMEGSQPRAITGIEKLAFDLEGLRDRIDAIRAGQGGWNRKPPRR